MDPLSITTGCIGVAGNIANLIYKITHFALQVRSSRRDMDAVARELISLKMSLAALEDEEQKRRTSWPPDMHKQIHNILLNIEIITQQINDLLIRLSSGKLGRRIQWALGEQDEVNKLRSSLESNKTALEVTLTPGTISVLAQHRREIVDQGKDLSFIIRQTQGISITAATIDTKVDKLMDMQRSPNQFNAIALEISMLRSQLGQVSKTNSIFAAQSQSYVDALLEPIKQAMLHNGSPTIDADIGFKAEALDLLNPDPTKPSIVTDLVIKSGRPLAGSQLNTVTREQLRQSYIAARNIWKDELLHEQELVWQLRADLGNVIASSSALDEQLVRNENTNQSEGNGQSLHQEQHADRNKHKDGKGHSYSSLKLALPKALVLNTTELVFVRRVGRVDYNYVSLTNPDAGSHLAFEFLTTASKHVLTIRPNMGLLTPKGTAVMQISRGGIKEEPVGNSKLRDHVLVKSVLVDNISFVEEDQTRFWENVSAKDRNKIREERIWL